MTRIPPLNPGSVSDTQPPHSTGADTERRLDFRDQLASEATLPAAGTEIRAAITRVLAAQSDVSNEQLYDTVYAELNGAEPLLAPHLLCFIDQFCIRLRDVLREIAAASIASEDAAKPESEKNTPYVRSVTTPYFASQFPAQAIERLDAFAALQVSDPSAARIFALSHFAGCADSEIADLLELRAGDLPPISVPVLMRVRVG